jgi:hypothetical protein
MHIQNIDIIVATVPVLVTTVFFTILIVARIYATSLPVDPALKIDPNNLGIDGLS